MSNRQRIRSRDTFRRRVKGMDVSPAEKALRISWELPVKEDAELMLDDVITQLDEFESVHPVESCHFCKVLLERALEVQHATAESGDTASRMGEHGLGVDLVVVQLMHAQKWAYLAHRTLVALREAHMVSSS